MFEHTKCQWENLVSPKTHLIFYWCRGKKGFDIEISCIFRKVSCHWMSCISVTSAAHSGILLFSRLVTMEDHYPSTYVEAQCLCSGCIMFQNQKLIESHDYNSVPVMQSKLFLKREVCNDKKKYRLTPVSIDVAVGCTCARATTSSTHPDQLSQWHATLTVAFVLKCTKFSRMSNSGV